MRLLFMSFLAVVLPVSAAVFERNAGQTDARVRFIARGSASIVWITNREIVMKNSSGAVTTLRLIGASASTVRGTTPAEQKVNWFAGRDPARWKTGLPTFATVRQNDVYPGIDTSYRALGDGIEIDWHVAPGADARQIRVVAEDRRGRRIRPRLDANGDVVFGTLRLRAPRSLQGDRIVESRFVTGGSKSVTVRLAPYDRTRPLIIDPVLTYSSHIGGTNSEIVPANLPGTTGSVAADFSGNAYITGNTLSSDFPLTTAADSTLGMSDAFVVKFAPSGTTVVYATFLGGSKEEDGTGIAVDSSGNAYVTGVTKSVDFPTTGGSFQPVTAINDAAGQYRGFVTKLTTSGALSYSTYLGGSYRDQPNAIVVNANGNAFIGGSTSSTNFPTTQGAFQTARADADTTNQGLFDAFVTELNSTGSGLVYSTYLGGGLGLCCGEGAVDIAIDSSDQAYVVGTSTSSSDFPTTVGAYSQTMKGNQDIFVTKLAANGGSLVYSTFISAKNDGNGELELPAAIAVDSSGNATIAGTVQYNNSTFPTTGGAFLSSRIGRYGFLTRLNGTGTALVYSTYIGSQSDPEQGATDIYSLVLDASGNATVVGNTLANNFPVTGDALQPIGGNDSKGFITRLDATASSVTFSTPIGKNGALRNINIGYELRPLDIANGGNGDQFVLFKIGSNDYPTANTYMPAANGVVVMRLSNTTPAAGSVGFTATSFSTTESTTPYSVIVNRTGGSTGQVTVDYLTSYYNDTPLQADGCPTSETGLFCDYTKITGTLTFANGETSKTISLPVRRDENIDPGESFLLRLTNATGGAALGIYETRIDVVDDPTLAFELTKSSVDVNEGAGSTFLRVQRVGDKTTAGSVSYSTASGTATAGSDFTTTSGVLSFATNQTEQDVIIPITNDTNWDPEETFTFSISNPTNGHGIGSPSAATIRIIDDDFGPPTNVVATATSTTAVTVSWSAAPQAAHYELERKTGNGAYQSIGTTFGTSMPDAVSADNVYLYHVRSFTSGGAPSDYGIPDIASTFTFTDDPLVANTTAIKALQVTQLRTAVDAVRQAASLSPFGWTDPSLSGVLVKRMHMVDLRTALDQARTPLGLAALVYSDPSIVQFSTLTRAAHLQEIRSGVR